VVFIQASDEPFDLLFFGEVAAFSMSGQSLVPKTVGGLSKTGFSNIDQHDLGTGPKETLGEGSPVATGSAGDDSGAT
jgi:hypothetical protein